MNDQLEQTNNFGYGGLEASKQFGNFAWADISHWNEYFEKRPCVMNESWGGNDVIVVVVGGVDVDVIDNNASNDDDPVIGVWYGNLLMYFVAQMVMN